MGFFDFFRKLLRPEREQEKPLVTSMVPPRDSPPGDTPIDFSRPITQEEKELTAVVAAAALAEAGDNVQYRVHSVTGVDTEKEIAAAIATAVAAGERTEASFRLVSITRTK